MGNIKKFLPVFFLLLAGLLSALAGKETKISELRFGLLSEPATLDPLSLANTADSRSVLFNVYEGLVRPDTSGALLPASAESWTISGDALVYTFTIREGLKFHDNTPVTAGDVEFSIEQAAIANFTGIRQIEKIETNGTRVIKITLSAPDPDFLPYLTFGIVPKNNADRERNPVGTGPFKIENYIPQQQLVLARNPNYWRSDLPKLDKVTLLFTGDTNGLYTGLEGGNISGAMIPGDIANRLDLRKYEIVTGYSNSIQMLALNNNIKPFDDIRVRQAINYAVDALEIIETAFNGQGEPSGSPLIPGLKHYYNDALKNPYPVDLAKARSLLAEAGYANGFSLEIKVPSNYTMHIDTAQVIVNQLARINVSASIRLVDWATWLSDAYRNRNYEATIISLDGSTLSPQSFLARYVSSSGSNFINYKNENYDRIYARALGEVDESARIRLYKEAQKIISDDSPAVFIQDIYAYQVYSGGFRGAQTYPLYVLDFSSIYR